MNIRGKEKRRKRRKIDCVKKREFAFYRRFMVKMFLKLYKEVKSEFSKSLKLAEFRFLPAMRTFEQSFNIDEDKIIIEADKNVGYVCIKKSDLFEQYSKINEQQHFGLRNISEEWYNTKYP